MDGTVLVADDDRTIRRIVEKSTLHQAASNDQQ